MMLPDKIRELEVAINGRLSGQLLKHSVYEYRYGRPDPEQATIALLMPPAESPTWQDGDLFAALDQHLPEGDLFMRLRALFPKQPLTPMHLLALAGTNGIGRLGFSLPDAAVPVMGPTMDRQTLLSMPYSPEVFDELVRAYLSTGAGIAGMQPKIMVPDRPTVPIPSLIVKAASPAYPGLAANEFLCLSAARRAGIETPTFDLSHDGQMLVLDRFDLVTRPDGGVDRLGFEDVASLMGLRVRDVLSDRKYQGSYERVAELLRYLMLPSESIHRFFEQVAFSVMVRNGDGHLKNFGVLYTSTSDVRLAPMFDVVTTAVYRYARYSGGPELEDRTMALKLFGGKHRSKAYPTTEELVQFGRKVCGIGHPEKVLARIAQGMADTLVAARCDERISGWLLNELAPVWQEGCLYGGAS
ncbi:MAG: type II toxin-antitoxin system HipA family toxin [Aquabacterium sp.]